MEQAPRPLTEAEGYELARIRAEMQLREEGKKPTQKEIYALADKLFAEENKRLGITSEP